ncbi:hypothetical protein [Nostoc sp. C057]|uniref:hypothetical protein n=1 Tax=Nostoc sp. C057 TaxID=2576903 RepID=UPI00277B5CC7|nr:hypothetical protein [Nostoc sp. C057]
MKKWIWLMLLVLMAVAVVSSRGSTFFEQRPSPEIVESIPVETPQPHPELKEVDSAPQVSADRHIQKLNFQRYTTQERSHTRSYITTELTKLC